MKKALLSLLTLCLTAFTAVAQSYTETLIVTVDGTSADPSLATVLVERAADNTSCTFSLTNFHLITEDSDIAVGNIKLSGVTMVAKDGYYEISTNQTINIEPGNEEGINEAVWWGPQLGDIPVVLTGKITDKHLAANLDIDMTETIGQVINVKLGDETTGIATVATANPATANSGVFTLSGTRIANKFSNSLPKGTYIVNGKKVIK